MNKPARKGSIRWAVERVAPVMQPILLLATIATAAGLNYHEVAGLLRAAMDRCAREAEAATRKPRSRRG